MLGGSTSNKPYESDNWFSALGRAAEPRLGEKGMSGTIRARRRRRAGAWLVLGASAAAVLGALMPAQGALLTTVEECLRQGGHESGKYCSGGYQDGFLIF